MKQETILIEKNCCVCGSKNKTKVYDLYHSNSEVLKLLNLDKDISNTLSHIYKCLNCNHHYLSPIVSDELMNKYYSVINSEYYKKIEIPNDHLAEEHKTISRKIKSLKN